MLPSGDPNAELMPPRSRRCPHSPVGTSFSLAAAAPPTGLDSLKLPSKSKGSVEISGLTEEHEEAWVKARQGRQSRSHEHPGMLRLEEIMEQQELFAFYRNSATRSAEQPFAA